jgi:hypothetical protein
MTPPKCRRYLNCHQLPTVRAQSRRLPEPPRPDARGMLVDEAGLLGLKLGTIRPSGRRHPA